MCTVFFTVGIQIFVQLSFAAEDNYKSFNDIVSELSNTNSYSYTPNSELDIIRIHGQIAFLTSRTQLRLPRSLPSGVTLQGAEAKLGIDLFSPRWIAMGGVRTFDQTRFSTGTVQLKEFDLEVLYKDSLSPKMTYTIGAGMAARYLDFRGSFAEDFVKSHSTPASILNLGIDARIAKFVSVGALLSYRTTLISESADEGAIDGAIHLTGHF